MSKRLKVGVAAAVAVPVLAFASWAGWAMVAGRAADRVEAGWTLNCTGTKVGSYEGEQAIRSRPGWRCDVALTITNRGDRTARVVRVHAPLLGTEGGAEIRGYSTEEAELQDVEAPRCRGSKG